MLKFGKELTSIMEKLMDTRKAIMTRTIFKLMVILKRPRLILDFHTHQLCPRNLLQKHWPRSEMPRQLLQRVMLEFHTLMLAEITIQEHLPWIQMVKFGKELTSMMVKFMVRKNIKVMLMIFKLMVILKKLLLIQDFLMLQPFHKRIQLQLKL